MLELNIPGQGNLKISQLVLDYNGTLAQDGSLLAGVEQRLNLLKKQLKIHVLTADTFGSVRKNMKKIDSLLKIIEEQNQAEQKLNYLVKINPSQCIAIGNGRNDRLMLASAALGILVIQKEGAAVSALQQTDIVVNNILDALDLLIYPKRLQATIRD